MVESGCCLVWDPPQQERPGRIAIDRRPPHVVYIAPDGAVIPTPKNTAPSPAITFTAIVPTPDNHANPITMERTPDAPLGEAIRMVTHQIEIVGEASGLDLFATLFVGDIPFSGPPIAPCWKSRESSCHGSSGARRNRSLPC